MLRSDAWIKQAQSDFDTALLLSQQDGEQWFCQAIAKLQQCVEKSVKALVDLLSDGGIASHQIGRGHDVRRYISMFQRIPKSSQNKSIQSQISGVFDERTRMDVERLDRLAPRWPAPGAPFALNSEYPFQRDDQWTCPCTDGNFHQSDVKKLRTSASRILNAILRVRSAIRRML